MSATSSEPPMSTSASRSPSAIARIRADSLAMRRSNTRPTNSQAMSTAPTTLTTFKASSRARPVVMVWVAAWVAPVALALASATNCSTPSTSRAMRSPLSAKRAC